MKTKTILAIAVMMVLAAGVVFADYTPPPFSIAPTPKPIFTPTPISPAPDSGSAGIPVPFSLKPEAPAGGFYLANTYSDQEIIQNALNNAKQTKNNDKWTAAEQISAFLNPSMGSYKVQGLVEELFGDVTIVDTTKKWGELWAYAEQGMEYYAADKIFCNKKQSSWFIQDYAGHYVGAGEFPTLNSVTMYILGKRTEYAAEGGIDWNTAYNIDGKAPQWFPKVMSSVPTYGTTTTATTLKGSTTTTLIYSKSNPSLAAMGYLYKLSWLVKHPYTADDVAAMSLDEKHDNGLDDDGNITFRIYITETGAPCMAKSCYQLSPKYYLEPGSQISQTKVQYKLPYLSGVCIRFDSYKWDKVHLEYPAGCQSPDGKLGAIVKEELTAPLYYNNPSGGSLGSSGSTGDGSNEWNW